MLGNEGKRLLISGSYGAVRRSRQQRLDVVERRRFGQFGEYRSQIGIGFQAVRFRCFDQRVQIGTGFHAYLRYLFTELPQAQTVDAIEALLPGNLDQNQIKIG